MEVTSIRMNLLNNAGGIKAIGSFSLDDAFAIRIKQTGKLRRGIVKNIIHQRQTSDQQ